MTAPYDHEALWLKAKLFTTHALDAAGTRTFDERALWASLALEMLAKASLARVSPLLIATPDEKGGNLLIASGLMEGTARFNTIAAHTLFERCHKAYSPFSLDDAKRIAAERNEYLHGAAASFTPIPEKGWWPRYWALITVLVNALDRDLDELVGPDHLDDVNNHLVQNKKNLEDRLKMLLERAKQRLAQYEAGTLPAKVAKGWKPGDPVDAGLPHSADAPCPACDQMGLLEGSEVEDMDIRYEQISEDDFEAVVDLTVTSERFSCSNCALVLENEELVIAAGLDDTFGSYGGPEDVEEYEYDYGND